MKRILAVIAIAGLVTVSALENSILYLCGLVGCEVSCAAQAPESLPMDCESCCAYEEFCETEETCDNEALCGVSGCGPFETSATPEDAEPPGPQWTLAQACTCAPSGPPLIGVIQEYQLKGSEMIVSELLTPGPQFDKSMGDSFPESARFPGIHPLISATVLRL